MTQGRDRRGLRAAAEADRRLRECEGRSAYARGTGAALTVAAAGAAVWGALALGGPAVRSGSLAAVALAVVVLTPLAVHEVFGGLAPAAQQIPRLRSAAAGIRPVDVPIPGDRARRADAGTAGALRHPH